MEIDTFEVLKYIATLHNIHTENSFLYLQVHMEAR